MKKTCCVLVITLVLLLTGCKSSDYKKANTYLSVGEYKAAKEIFLQLGDYKDSSDRVTECDYQIALSRIGDGEYYEAISILEDISDYNDSSEQIVFCKQKIFIETLGEGQTNVRNIQGIPFSLSISMQNDNTIKVTESSDGYLDGVAFDYEVELIVNLSTGIATYSEEWTVSSNVVSGYDYAVVEFSINGYEPNYIYEWDSCDIGVNFVGLTTGVDLENCVSIINDVVNACDDVTMSDLGFVSY